MEELYVFWESSLIEKTYLLEVGEETEKLKKRKINQLQHGSA
jgi:hypothetical protein